MTACPEKPHEDGTVSDGNEKIDNLVLELHKDGGMLPEFEDIYISKDSAYWKYRKNGYETLIRWIPTEEELEDLLRLIKENNYKKIESDCDRQVFDRGGISIDIAVADKDYRINNSGNCFIKDKWASNFGSIKSGIRKYAENYIREQLIPVNVLVDESILESAYPFTLRLNGNTLYQHDQEHPESTIVKLYPGYNEIYIQLFEKVKGQLSTLQFESTFIEVNKQDEQLNISWIDDRFEYDLKP